jgi:hypothetical protein
MRKACLIIVMCGFWSISFGQSGDKIRVLAKSEVRSLKVKIILEEPRDVIFWDCEKDKNILFQPKIIGENVFENFGYQNYSLFFREAIRREGKAVIIFLVRDAQLVPMYELKYENENLNKL